MLKVNGIGTNNLAHTNQKYSEVTALMSKNRENHQKRHFTMIKEEIKILNIHGFRQQKSTKTMEFYAAEKKKEIIPFARAWMELESIMLSEINQTVRDEYHMISPLTGT